MFKSFKIVNVTIDEMNEHLKYCYKFRKIIIGKGKPANVPFGLNAYIHNSPTNFELSYKRGKHACTYKCRKDQKEAEVCGTTGMNAYRTLQRYLKTIKYNDDSSVKAIVGWNEQDKKFYAATSPYTYENPKYNRTRTENCICYDLNSSYGNALTHAPLPSQKHPIMYYHKLKKGEIGFKIINGRLKTIYEEGKTCSIAFKLMSDEERKPIVKFVNKYYELKKKAAKGSKEKLTAKQMLNYSIGYMQKTNPFIRTAVIDYANKFITDLKEKYEDYILYSNTDSLVSTVKIKECEENLGVECGQWKIEHEGSFAYIDSCYQWNLETPSWKHIPKSAFKETYDLLKDPAPALDAGNIVKFDAERGQLIYDKNNI